MTPEPTHILGTTELQYAVARLREADPKTIGKMIDAAGPPPLRARPGGMAGLVRIIIAQQVSTASANAIYTRFNQYFGFCDHLRLLRADENEFRTCGLSMPKIRTIRHVCSAIEEGRLNIDVLHEADVETAREELVAVKGIGPWTADIYFLFCLGHRDVWPAGDLALQEGVRIAMNLSKRPDPVRLEKIARRWQPWRAVAARIIWSYYAIAKAGETENIANSDRTKNSAANKKTPGKRVARQPLANNARQPLANNAKPAKRVPIGNK